jgi:hypothetical protein
MSDAWARILDRLQFEAKNALDTVSACICKPSSSIKINGRTCPSRTSAPSSETHVRTG